MSLFSQRTGVLTALLLAGAAGVPVRARAQTALRVVSGVERDGRATPQWLAMLDHRLDESEYAGVAGIVRPYSPEEESWARLIRSRVADWARQTRSVAAPYRPAKEPDTALVVLGNRGASDAFTHDPRTIGFDLHALQAAYGDAALPENTDRIDRLFRHEFAHLMQKAWLAEHPYPTDTPIRVALLDIWTEGLGNFLSLSARWRATADGPSDPAREALARLAPRFVARMIALACAPPAGAAALLADLSSGRFDQKWGALPAALWLDEENAARPDAIRAFIQAGPDGVWDFVGRHLGEDLAATVDEGRRAAALCTSV